MTIKTADLEDVIPCSLVEVSQSFRGNLLSSFSITVQGLPVEFSLKFSTGVFIHV